jgi:hypothetical protein
VILFITFIVRPSESWDCRRNRLMSSRKIGGVVSQKIYDSKDHNYEKAITNDGSIFTWEDSFYGNLAVYDHISIGDSIVKKDKSLLLEIYRKDTFFILDLTLPCDEK